MIEEPEDRVNGDLSQVEVRPIRREERSRWDELMRRHHYLGLERLAGESLRYVAEAQGRWLALIGWTSAAFKCKPRDAWIGWSPQVQWERLERVVNNARFLILPGARLRNLASRVLGLNLRRLASDWEKAFGHGVDLAETFVDEARYAGTCYRAAGWQRLGTTQGYGKQGKRWRRHGKPKSIWVRELRRDARVRLSDPRVEKEGRVRTAAVKPSKRQQEELVELLRGFPDKRTPQGVRHRILSVLAISICAVLGGAKSYQGIAEWGAQASQTLRRRLRCWRNPRTGLYEAPSETTIRRVLQQIDAAAADSRLGKWLAPLEPDLKGVAIDGKTVKGARRADGRQVHLLSAVTHREGLFLGQVEVESKENEIVCARPLLEPLDLRGIVVTADAMHTQRDLATWLVEEKQADYCFVVKDNQPTLAEDIATLRLTEGFPPSA